MWTHLRLFAVSVYENAQRTFLRFTFSTAIKNAREFVNYLDENLNIVTGLYSSYHKPINNWKYIKFNN